MKCKLFSHDNIEKNKLITGNHTYIRLDIVVKALMRNLMKTR